MKWYKKAGFLLVAGASLLRPSGLWSEIINQLMAR